MQRAAALPGALFAALALLLAGAAGAGQQRDPQLQAVVAHAIAQAECFTDQYDSAV